jgi:hypothetical protein
MADFVISLDTIADAPGPDASLPQVEWAPLEGRALPARLREEVDSDGDGSADFVISLDTIADDP